MIEGAPLKATAAAETELFPVRQGLPLEISGQVFMALQGIRSGILSPIAT
jgi:hypothetical protein